eukprot:COSAG06_NODE_4761_length_3975_cov_7.211042_2_plen_164_part_00
MKASCASTRGYYSCRRHCTHRKQSAYGTSVLPRVDLQQDLPIDEIRRRQQNAVWRQRTHVHCDWLIYCARVPLRRARNHARRRERVYGGRMLRRRLRPGDGYGFSLLLSSDSSRGPGARRAAARAAWVSHRPPRAALADVTLAPDCRLAVRRHCSCGEHATYS